MASVPIIPSGWRKALSMSASAIMVNTIMASACSATRSAPGAGDVRQGRLQVMPGRCTQPGDAGQIAAVKIIKSTIADAQSDGALVFTGPVMGR